MSRTDGTQVILLDIDLHCDICEDDYEKVEASWDGADNILEWRCPCGAYGSEYVEQER